MSGWVIGIVVMVFLGGLLAITGMGALAFAVVRRARLFLRAPGYFARRWLRPGSSASAESRAIAARIHGLLEQAGNRGAAGELARDTLARVDSLSGHVARLEAKHLEVDQYIEVDLRSSKTGQSLAEGQKPSIERLERRRSDLAEAIRKGVETLKEIEVKVATLRLCADDGGEDNASQRELEDISRDLDVFIEETDRLQQIGS